MNQNKQRIAIAEYLGWKQIGKYPDDIKGIKPPMRGWINVPDYLNDLNAIHEVEKCLSASQLSAYVGELANVIINGENKTTLGNQMWHATAKQRSEAFLKTIGKWEK
jgi:hypothetical protein